MVGGPANVLRYNRSVKFGREVTMPSYQPKPEHKFTFGMWTVGNVGRDPFGEPVRQALKPLEIVRLLADV